MTTFITSSKTYTVSPHQDEVFFLFQGLMNERNFDVKIKLGKESNATIYGLVIGNDNQKLRTDLEVIHAAPGAQSHIVLKGVFADQAQGIINGTITIDKKAQRTDAMLEERVLLLSPQAHAETIPNLEIEADDVKAKHAATIGKISEEEIFYLQSRGLERNEAQRMIVRAFLGSILVHLPKGPKHDTLDALLSARLETLSYESF